jgi:hypothetical protein
LRFQHLAGAELVVSLVSQRELLAVGESRVVPRLAGGFVDGLNAGGWCRFVEPLAAPCAIFRADSPSRFLLIRNAPVFARCSVGCKTFCYQRGTISVFRVTDSLPAFFRLPQSFNSCGIQNQAMLSGISAGVVLNP